MIAPLLYAAWREGAPADQVVPPTKLERPLATKRAEMESVRDIVMNARFRAVARVSGGVFAVA